MIAVLSVVQGEETTRSIHEPPQEAPDLASAMPSSEVSGHLFAWISRGIELLQY
jgi:hypothetical protein